MATKPTNHLTSYQPTTEAPRRACFVPTLLASANSTVPAVPGAWWAAAFPAAVPGAAPALPMPVGARSVGPN